MLTKSKNTDCTYVTQTDNGSFKKVVSQIVRVRHLFILKEHPELIINLRVAKPTAGHDKLLNGGRVQLWIVLSVALVVDAQTKVLHQLFAENGRQVLRVDHHALFSHGDASIYKVK